MTTIYASTITQDISSCLQQLALTKPNKIAYRFVSQHQESTITYSELDTRARQLAPWFGQSTGERVLLFLDPGFDYIVAFFACFYAGVVPVPCYPPRNSRHMIRLQNIIDDAKAKFIITYQAKQAQFDFKEAVLCVDNYSVDHQDFTPVVLKGGQLAFLQYTSGSTGSPKGVMVTHTNIMNNLQMMRETFKPENLTALCSWLPPYHDMGLIAGILLPIYCQSLGVLMSPQSFLQSPMLWLEAISKYRVNFSPAPNFAYDLCVDKITSEQKQLLDLSQWRVAANGAERINPKTFTKFNRYFEDCGLSETTLYPCYGMAETTLKITGKPVCERPSAKSICKLAFQNGKIKQLPLSESDALHIVDCGVALPEHEVIIVDPESCDRLAVDEMGEIWVRGESIASGYWEKPELNKHVFKAITRDQSECLYFRTGDLGFLDGRQHLFVTGRLKDLMIIKGKNFAPQDIEYISESADAALIPDGSAAFTIQDNGKESLVVVAEVRRHVKDFVNIYQNIIQQLNHQQNITPSKIVLIRQVSLPKTSSGKIQRYACKQALLDGQLKRVHSWPTDEDS